MAFDADRGTAIRATKITTERLIDAAPDAVWALLEDCSWPRWSGYESVEVESSSDGVATRCCHSADVAVREHVRVDREARCISYEHISGLPVRRYTTAITLTADGERTRVEWCARVEPLIADSRGVITVLRAAIEQGCDELARTAGAGAAA